MGSALPSPRHTSARYRREAHHAGSWYSAESEELASKLESLLSNAEIPRAAARSCLRAAIVPHAGYSYSGPTAAYSYKAIQRELSLPNSPIRKILVLHPSHHVYMDGCAVSGAMTLSTPLGDLTVDEELRQDLLKVPGMTVMKKGEDEREHSGEMQYPYLAHILQDRPITVTPVMCGSLSTEAESRYGKELRSIVGRLDVLTVVSTDFCHWGGRFSFQPMPTDKTPIHEFIKALDRRGMDLIQLQQPGAFADYLKETRNTICGRHPIAVWMRALEAGTEEVTIEFVRYAQSSSATSRRDSSVSYAAALASSIS